MTDTPPTPESSLLKEIIRASQEINVSHGPTSPWIIDEKVSPSGTPPPKKPKEPINPVLILKWIGSIFLVALIFFWSFLAYIVLHPEQAQFFVTTFGINPNDVANILKRLITLSFGVITFVLSIAWIIILFRAIWTPKELKRKKILSWILVVFIAILLFSSLAFWAYLFKILSTTDFVNLEWRISIYDATLASNPLTEKYANLSTTNNLLGPISLKFKIDSNALAIEKSNLIRINNYEINFDGAICNSGSSIVKWSNPTSSNGIVCTFDTTRLYSLRWTYIWVDNLGRPKEIPMNLPPVDIRGLISLKKQKNRNNEDIITLDASNVRNLWNPRWLYEATNEEISKPFITEKVLSTPQIIGLKLFWNDMDRIFLIENETDNSFTGSISLTQDPYKSLTYAFEVKNLSFPDSDIVSVLWTLDDGSIICKWTSLRCEHTFWNYNSYLLRARIELANQEFRTLEKTISIDPPLIISRNAKITDEKWKILNTPETYDPKLRAYIIKDTIPPTKIFLDSRDVTSENLDYRLSKTSWKLSDGKKIEEKEGEEVTFDLIEPLRYVVNIRYTFSPNVSKWNDDKFQDETVIFDIEHKSLIPRITIQSPRDYVPVVITVDGSLSESENNEIKKFVYDFGDGRPPISGDAIQQYEYKTSGKKTIQLTIVNDRGEESSTKKIIVLKDNPRTIDFTPSISPWVVGVPVDFTPSLSEANIEDYIWTFGDNSTALREPAPSHVFINPGTYTVTLTIVYNDGTRKESRKEFSVIEGENFR